MTDFVMTPRNKPTAKTRLQPGTDSLNTLRAYRASPEAVNVQIRWGKGFVTAALSYEEAKRFAYMVSEAAKELPADVKRGAT